MYHNDSLCLWNIGQLLCKDYETWRISIGMVIVYVADRENCENNEKNLHKSIMWVMYLELVSLRIARLARR